MTVPKRDAAVRRRRKDELTLVAHQRAEFLRLAAVAAEIRAGSKRLPRKPAAARRRSGKKR